MGHSDHRWAIQTRPGADALGTREFFFKYSYSCSLKLWVMYSCAMYSDFMSTSEYFFKYVAVIIIYEFILKTLSSGRMTIFLFKYFHEVSKMFKYIISD